MEKYDVKFKKKFGQNFLKDINIVKKIISTADIKNNSVVIEVGPGGAIMTRELSNIASNVLAYEIDETLKDELYKRIHDKNNIEILFKDFLSSDLCSDIAKFKYDNLYFVSNVPYYITTPIIMKLINSNLKFNKIVMMVQKEVGERLSSNPGSKNYGAISVLLQYFYNVKNEFFVSRNEFVPIPNVDSVVISFTPKDILYKVNDIELFSQFIFDCFQFKRKNIKNNLKKYNLSIIEEILNKYGFDLSVRSEYLSVEIFVDLFNSLF